MNVPEKLFVNTLDDLEKKFQELTEYSMLKSSGIIRQLLVDSNPLLTQANKNSKLKIRFRVQKRFEIHENYVDPDGLEWQNFHGMIFISPPKDSNFVELLNKDEFLKYEIVSHFQNKFTVLDILKICANKYGGIHLDNIRDEKNSNLDKLNSSVKLNDSNILFQAMHGIIEVCLNTLNPLKEHIIKNNCA